MYCYISSYIIPLHCTYDYVNSGRSVRLKKGGGVPTQEKIGGSNHMVPFKCIDRPQKRGFQPPKLSPGSATSQVKKNLFHAYRSIVSVQKCIPISFSRGFYKRKRLCFMPIISIYTIDMTGVYYYIIAIKN